MTEPWSHFHLRFPPRQMEILRLLSEGKTNRGIAEGMVPRIAPHTVENQLNVIYTALGLDYGEINVRVMAARWYWWNLYQSPNV